AAWQSLPPELRKIEDHPAKESFDHLLIAAPHEGDYIFVPTASLAGLAGVSERPKLTLLQSRQLSQLAKGLGWQLAPDPEVTTLPLAWNQELALYRVRPDEEIIADLPGVLRLL